MNILRVRRGFTTNSSGSNEYVTSAQQPAAPQETWNPVLKRWEYAQPSPATAPGNQTDAGNASPAQQALPPGQPGTFFPAKAAPISITDGGMSSAVTDQTGAAGTTGIGNAFILIAFILCVLLLFAGERIVRLVRRKSGKARHESSANGEQR